MLDKELILTIGEPEPSSARIKEFNIEKQFG